MLRGVVALLLLLTARLGPAQMIDLNTNGMSDVWEQIYGASAVVPGADADGDGYSNLKEALAGTSPFSTNSFPKISTGVKAGTNFTVTLPCELGKQYQLQSVTVAGSTNWVVETNVVVRSGTSLTLTASAGASLKLFRTAVSDVDTDGDGVNDWEEYKLGLDPFDPLSNGTLDTNGQLMNDYAYATGKFASQNIFSITATDPSTVQPDPGQSATDLGTLTISRGGFPLKAVTVNVTEIFCELTPIGNVMARGKKVWSTPSVAKPAPVASVTLTVTALSGKPPREIVSVPRSVAGWPGSGCTVVGSEAVMEKIFCEPNFPVA